MPDLLRIDSVAIEGFKGFTNRQVIQLDGSHLFVLGPNGYGKSSIVEGLRWGLFGSTLRRGEIVANQWYPGTCRVEITFRKADKKYVLRRTLLKGVTGGNDPTLYDETGQIINLGDLLPHLDSVATGEGMHIVYTGQGSAGKRTSPENLSSFSRTVYAYAGLSDIPLLTERLSDWACLDLTDT